MFVDTHMIVVICDENRRMKSIPCRIVGCPCRDNVKDKFITHFAGYEEEIEK